MKKLGFLIGLLFLIAVPVERLYAAKSCYKLFEDNPKQYWTEQVQTTYSASNKKWFRVNSLASFGLGGLYPKSAYDLGSRLRQDEHHASWAQKLGFHEVVDEKGIPALLPPEHFKTFVEKYYEDSGKENANGGHSSDFFDVGLMFIKKNKRKLSNNIEDYKVIKLSDPKAKWPDPEMYKLIWEFDSIQLPQPIFIWLFAKGIILLPNKEFIDHEYAHITEIASNPKFAKELKRYAELVGRRGYNEKSESAKRLKDREFILLEYFNLPDLRKVDQIRGLLPHLFASEQTHDLQSLKEFLKRKYSDTAVIKYAADFIESVRPLIYRQGGAMRDTYNLQGRMRSIGHIRGHIEVLAGKAPAALESFDGINQNEHGRHWSLLGYIFHIEYLLSIYESQFESEYFHVTMNQGLKVNKKQFRELILESLCYHVAAIQMALYTGVKLDLKPEESLADGLQLHVDQSSKTVRYLKSFLPDYSFPVLSFTN